MTVIILALDALDAGLVEHFDIDDFRLGSSTTIETFAHSKDEPYTPEVWASVATGLGPEKHGVTKSGTSEWDNPLLEFASHFTGHLSEGTRGTLGRFIRNATGEREQIGSTDEPTIFDRSGAVVRNWPGVDDGRDLQYAWDLMNAVADDMPKAEFERRLLGQCAEQFGWAREMLRHDLTIAGVHVHALDAAGHAYADDEAALRQIYERVGELVAELASILGEKDELLLLSDHGICTSFLPEDHGEAVASHSWRAYASTTSKDVPRSVFDIRDWADDHAIDDKLADESVEMPVEQLRKLGYME